MRWRLRREVIYGYTLLFVDFLCPRYRSIYLAACLVSRTAMHTVAAANIFLSVIVLLDLGPESTEQIELKFSVNTPCCPSTVCST